MEIAEVPQPPFDNFPEGKYELKAARSLTAGHMKSRSIMRNLSAYRLYSVPVEEVTRDEHEIMKFDIEDTTTKSGGNTSHAYSTMINGYYPMSYLEQLRARVGQLPGFTPDPEVGADTMHSPEQNLFVNITMGEGNVCLGVIQERHDSNFKRVVDTVVPQAVSIFNTLSPSLKVGTELMDRSISMASGLVNPPPATLA